MSDSVFVLNNMDGTLPPSKWRWQRP